MSLRENSYFVKAGDGSKENLVVQAKFLAGKGWLYIYIYIYVFVVEIYIRILGIQVLVITFNT